MNSRLFSIIGVLTIAAATLESAEIPRTASGRPDLTGTYDVATLTPLERPEKFGDKLILTGEEAEAIAKEEVEFMRNVKRVEWKDGARIGAVPTDLSGPRIDHRKDALAVGRDQQVGGEMLWIDRASVCSHAGSLARVQTRSVPAKAMTSALHRKRSLGNVTSPMQNAAEIG